MIDGLASSGHALAFDGKGNVFVSLDGVGNICADPAVPKPAKPVGLKPCPSLTGRAGIWRFDAAKSGQHFPADGERIATGIRAMSGMDWSQSDGALYGLMHARDATSTTCRIWSAPPTTTPSAMKCTVLSKSSDLGWPYTYFDGARKLRLVSPEYGGDGKTVAPAGVCTCRW